MAKPISKANQLPTLLPKIRKEKSMMKQRYYLCVGSDLLNDQYTKIKKKYTDPDLTFQACIQQVISSSFTWYINYLESGDLWFSSDHTGKFQNIS
jgi:hypothetical protein